MGKDVYVVIEQRDGHVQKVGLELIGEARNLAGELGQQVTAVILGDQVADKAGLLYQYGAERVIAIEHPLLKEYATEPYAKGLTQAIRGSCCLALPPSGGTWRPGWRRESIRD